MPRRNIPLVNEEIYHIVNRGAGGYPIFQTKYDYYRFLNVLNYYKHQNPQISFSELKRLNTLDRTYVLNKHFNKSALIDILGYCLMPNHFHLLIKQSEDNGISSCLRKTCNAYSSYFNKKYRRAGSLYQSVFKVVHIISEEQLIHTLRYIHLNPYTGSLVSIEKLELFEWSSLKFYLNLEKSNSLLKKNREWILRFFPSIDHFKSFTYDQADYAKQLQKHKNLFLE